MKKTTTNNKIMAKFAYKNVDPRSGLLFSNLSLFIVHTCLELMFQAT
jgi:hypothetical protein